MEAVLYDTNRVKRFVCSEVNFVVDQESGGKWITNKSVMQFEPCFGSDEKPTLKYIGIEISGIPFFIAELKDFAFPDKNSRPRFIAGKLKIKTPKYFTHAN